MLKPAQIIEKAFIRAFPGQSEAAKTLYRIELASWLNEALTALTRQVLQKHLLDRSDMGFRAFQRTYAARLGRRDALLTWSEQQMWSAERGWNWSAQGTNSPIVTVTESATETIITGVLNSMIAANEMLPAPAVTPAQPIANNSIEFTWESGPVALALFPDGVTPTASYEDANARLLILVEEPGQLSAYAQGVAVLNPDITVLVTSGDRVRAVFASNGAITLKVLGEGKTEKGSYPLLVWENDEQVEGTPLRITASVIPVLQFGDAGAEVKNVRIGLLDTRSVPLPRDYPLLIESLYQVGNVRFENGKPLTWLGESSFSRPRIAGLWGYTVQNNTLSIEPAIASPTAVPPSSRLLITGCVVLKCEDLQTDYDAVLIEILAGVARERAAMRKATK